VHDTYPGSDKTSDLYLLQWTMMFRLTTFVKKATTFAESIEFFLGKAIIKQIRYWLVHLARK
jgi:hypothetical protein